MKIRDFQNYIKDRLNEVEALVNGGCMAFAEDTRTVYNEAEQWISGGKVALVVVTPDISRDGDSDEGLPCNGDLVIRCIEKAPLAMADGVLRALDAAEAVMHALDSGTIHWKSTRQQADQTGKVFTATVTFDFSAILN